MLHRNPRVSPAVPLGPTGADRCHARMASDIDLDDDTVHCITVGAPPTTQSGVEDRLGC